MHALRESRNVGLYRINKTITPRFSPLRAKDVLDRRPADNPWAFERPRYRRQLLPYYPQQVFGRVCLNN